MKRSPHGRPGNPFTYTARDLQLPHKWKKRYLSASAMRRETLRGRERQKERKIILKLNVCTEFKARYPLEVQ